MNISSNDSNFFDLTPNSDFFRLTPGLLNPFTIGLRALEGNDTVIGSVSPELLDGGRGEDWLFGGSGNDILIGGQGNDLLRGGQGSDLLIGDEGDDLLIGDLDGDILTGGSGNDAFVLRTELNAAAAVDRIADFDPRFDRIGLTDNLSEADLNLEPLAGGTLIKVRGNNNILGQVGNVSPEQLRGRFISFANAVLDDNLNIPINLRTLSNSIGLNDSVGEDDFQDIYTFTTDTPSSITLGLSGLSADANLFLVRDANDDGELSPEEILSASDSSNSGTQSEVIENRFFVPSRYFVYVQQGVRGANTSYKLDITVKPIQFLLNTAIPIGTFSTGVKGSLDDVVYEKQPAKLYKFDLPQPSNLQVNLRGMSPGTDADLVLFQDVNKDNKIDFGEILGVPQQQGNNPEEIFFRGLSAGTYYLGVNPFVGDTRYNLSILAAPTTDKFNNLFGYGLVDAAAAVAAAIDKPLDAADPLTSAAKSNNIGELNQIDVAPAWKAGYTGKGVVVAVLDTGVDLSHPDLQSNIWRNPKEIPGDGIDNDLNGVPDDVNGWDFVNGDANPSPDLRDSLQNHGTEVAGIIGAKRNGIDINSPNNSYEMNGVAYDAQIMPIKVLGLGGQNNSDDDLAAGICYAVDNGANVINMSFGKRFASPKEREALKYAKEKGVFVVMAAGNDRGQLNPSEPNFPAFYAFDNLGIAVGAVTTPGKQVTTFSNPAGSIPTNFVVAPGHDGLSTAPITPNLEEGYDTLFRGTSMAAPYVAGVVALMLQAKPNLTPDEILEILTRTAKSEGITPEVN